MYLSIAASEVLVIGMSPDESHRKKEKAELEALKKQGMLQRHPCCREFKRRLLRSLRIGKTTFGADSIASGKGPMGGGGIKK